MKTIKEILLIAILIVFISCNGQVDTVSKIDDRIWLKDKDVVKPEVGTDDSLFTFKEVQERFDTLIPIFNNLFITHNNHKWGVIDSNGRAFISFMCDGIRPLSDSIGIASVFKSSYSLNTGMPRYMYIGQYYLFTINGKFSKPAGEFEILVSLRSDFHHQEYIIESGPYYYLPDIENDSIRKKSLRFTFR